MVACRGVPGPASAITVVMQASFMALKIPVYAFSCLPWQSGSFSCLHGCAFPKCHVVGVTQYVTLSNCLFSVSHTHLKSTDSSFLSSSEQCYITDVSQFIHWSAKGPPACFLILAVMSKAVTNISTFYVDLSFQHLWVNIKNGNNWTEW